MNRKHFLGSLLTAGSLLPGFPSLASIPPASIPVSPDVAPFTSASPPLPETPFRIPPYLQAGDTIGITCPAGFITSLEIQPSVQLMESWGFRIKAGDTVGKKDFTFGGTDVERAADFQQMLDDPSIRAIMCARGGYGAIRIIDKLDFSRFDKQPKWIIGFSDITVIHAHLHRNLRTASIHSKMCNSFPDDWPRAEPGQAASILSIRQALTGGSIDYPLSPGDRNRPGIAEGVLIGGNLKTLETLSGTDSDIATGDKILFVEDTGEYLYSIDRMFWNLERTGKLGGLKGLVIGGFKIKPDDPGEEFGKTIYDIVLDRVKAYDYPVCFDFPVGHQKNNFALKCGAPHRLEIHSGQALFRDLSVTHA